MMAKRLRATQHLYEGILVRQKNAMDAFAWIDLSDIDLATTWELLRAEVPVSADEMMDKVMGFVRVLAKRGICRHLDSDQYGTKTHDRIEYCLDERERNQGKQASPRVVAAVCDLFADDSLPPPDRLLICAVVILIFSGFRIGELLSLPVDCEHEERYHGRSYYGLRYFREKTRGGEQMHATRWLPPTNARVVRQAIAEIRGITAAARERARVLESHPDTVPIPDVEPGDWLSRNQVTDILGVASTRIGAIARSQRWDIHGKGEQANYRAADVMTYFQAQRSEEKTVIAPGGSQSLYETLLIVPHRFFRSHCTPQLLLVEAVDYDHIKLFLSGSGGSKSIFERLDIREPDGTTCKANPHSFRHWLNTIAQKGGLSNEHQALWFGRESEMGNRPYQHMQAGEQMQKARNMLRQSNEEIPADLTRLPWGYCARNLDVLPCPFAMQCLHGCTDYRISQGESAAMEALLSMRTQTFQALNQARIFPHMQEVWHAQQQDVLLNIQDVLDLLADTNIPDGFLVAPFLQK
jgi:hypothetical protein